jgi:hypothetical protein
MGQLESDRICVTFPRVQPGSQQLIAPCWRISAAAIIQRNFMDTVCVQDDEGVVGNRGGAKIADDVSQLHPQAEDFQRHTHQVCPCPHLCRSEYKINSGRFNANLNPMQRNLLVLFNKATLAQKLRQKAGETAVGSHQIRAIFAFASFENGGRIALEIPDCLEDEVLHILV